MAAKKKAPAKQGRNPKAKKRAEIDRNAHNASCPSAASADPDLKKPTIDIPLHLQDKEGFCGAACMMMLLEDAFPECLLRISQSALMRRVKQFRDAWRKKDQKLPQGELAKLDAQQQKDAYRPIKAPLDKNSGIPAEALYAWHASPREIEAVLNECFADGVNTNAKVKVAERQHTCSCGEDDPVLPLRNTPWEVKACVGWHDLPEAKQGHIPDKPVYAHTVLNEWLHDSNRGCIALIWHRTLGTPYPHWVVIESHDKEKNTYRILDPSPAGRPDRPLRYDSFPHYARLGPGERYYCDCLVWHDEHNVKHAAQKYDIHEDRLEELMDEAAARCGGLRYLIVRTGPLNRAASKSARKQAIKCGERGGASLSESLRDEDLKRKGRTIIQLAKTLGEISWAPAPPKVRKK